MTTRDELGREYDVRPWGMYIVLDDAAPDHKVKRIVVEPGKRLSYQRHAKRSEHWFVVSGIATVILDGTEHQVGHGHGGNSQVGGPLAVHGQAQFRLAPVLAAGDVHGPFDALDLGEDPGLGLLQGSVRRLPGAVKLPQMQWNRLEVVQENTLLGKDEEHWMYFVHSYAPEIGPETIATCEYGGPVAAAVQVGMLCGVQFHPEKSGDQGLALLRSFTLMVGAT